MRVTIDYDKTVDFPKDKTISAENLLTSLYGYYLLGKTITYAQLSTISNNILTLKGQCQRKEVLESLIVMNQDELYTFIYIALGELQYVKITNLSYDDSLNYEINLELQDRLPRMPWNQFSKQVDLGIMDDKLEVSGIDNLKQKFYFISNSSKGETFGNLDFGTFIYNIDKISDLSIYQKIILFVIELMENTLQREEYTDGTIFPTIPSLEKYKDICLVNYTEAEEIEFNINTVITDYGEYNYPDLKIDLKE